MTNSAENALSAKRVGQYLIDAGVLKPDQLDEALNRQKRMSKAGFHVLLGTILEEMGAIDRQSLEAVILRQRLDEGSVSLGSEADWTPFRSSAVAEPPPAPAEHRNGHLTPITEPTAKSAGAAEPVVESSAFRYEPIVHEPEPLNGSSSPQPDSQGDTSQVDAEEPHADFFGRPESPTSGPAQDAVRETVVSQALPSASSEPTAPASDFTAKPVSTANATRSDPSGPTFEQPAVRQEAPVSASTPEAVVRGDAVMAPAAVTEPPLSYPPAPPSMAFEVEAVQPSRDEGLQIPPPALEVLGFTFTRTLDGGLQENEVVAVIAQLGKRSQALEAQLSELSESVSHLDSMRRYGEQTIKAADTIADQIRTEAEQQAAAMRDRAQQEARRIIAEGRSRHDNILRQAAETARRLGSEVIKNIEQHRQLNDHLMEVTDAIVNTEPDTSGPGGSN